MTEQEARETFEHMTPEQILEAAVQLLLDAERLRRELDDLQGIIR